MENLNVVGGLSPNTPPHKNDLKALIEKYNKAKVQSSNILGFLNNLSDFEKRSLWVQGFNVQSIHHRLLNCSNYLVFRDYYTVNDLRLIQASFCRQHLLCQSCAIRRGAKFLQAYIAKFNEIRKEKNLKASLLTITVKNGDDLLERFNHLNNAHKQLLERRRDYLKKGWGKTEFRKIEGAVYSFEFTKKEKGWHPHLHAIVLHHPEDQIKTIDGKFYKENCSSPEDIPKDTLNYEWWKLTGDSYICDVRPMHNEENPIEDFIEVFKYSVKFTDLAINDQWHAYKTLKGKRLLNSYGAFWGVKIPESLLDELRPEDLPYIDYFYRWHSKSVGYSLEKTKKDYTDFFTPGFKDLLENLFTMPG